MSNIFQYHLFYKKKKKIAFYLVLVNENRVPDLIAELLNPKIQNVRGAQVPLEHAHFL